MELQSVTISQATHHGMFLLILVIRFSEQNHVHKVGVINRVTRLSTYIKKTKGLTLYICQQ